MLPPTCLVLSFVNEKLRLATCAKASQDGGGSMTAKDDGDASKSERATCADCGEKSPATSGSNNLISLKFGWRLRRDELPDGTRAGTWRCPSCWNKFKVGADASTGRSTRGQTG